jgi:hypothetical protein
MSDVWGRRTDVGGQRTDVRGQMSEDRCQRTDVRGQMSEVFEWGMRKVRGSRLKAQGKRGWWDLISESGMRNEVKRS